MGVASNSFGILILIGASAMIWKKVKEAANSIGGPFRKDWPEGHPARDPESGLEVFRIERKTLRFTSLFSRPDLVFLDESRKVIFEIQHRYPRGKLRNQSDFELTFRTSLPWIWERHRPYRGEISIQGGEQEIAKIERYYPESLITRGTEKFSCRMVNAPSPFRYNSGVAFYRGEDVVAELRSLPSSKWAFALAFLPGLDEELKMIISVFAITLRDGSSEYGTSSNY